MGNPQHLEWLLEGVEAWNARREREEFSPDFAGTDFRTAFEAEEMLTGAGRILLQKANLKGADLREADLREADLREADLERADLEGAYLEGADLRMANLSEADLRMANLKGAGLRNADLGGADLRRANLEGADLGGADLGGADLREADLGGADLRRANLEGADLGGADLGGADLREADLAGADLRGADLGEANVRSIVYSGAGTNDGGGREHTDLSSTIGLTQEQLNGMRGDSGTKLPEGLERPGHWSELGADDNRKPPTLPQPPLGNAVEVRGNRLTLGADAPVPERGELQAIFDDLREAVQDLRDLGNLSNQSPMLAKGIERFLRRIPDEFADLEQVRFGVGIQALRLQFGPEKAALSAFAPEKAGHIEAVLLYSDLIAARLPEWARFLAEEQDDKAVFEARIDDAEAILEHAAEALAKDPARFDVSLFARIREYLDDKTVEGYLASKELLLAIAHKTFSLARDLLKDTVTEQRKLAIKNIATALNVQLGAVLLELAGLLPRELHWLVAWLEYLPTLL